MVVLLCVSPHIKCISKTVNLQFPICKANWDQERTSNCLEPSICHQLFVETLSVQLALISSKQSFCTDFANLLRTGIEPLSHT